MAKNAAKSKHVGPEDKSQEEPEGQEGHGRTAPTSKSEAIRQALAAGFEGPQEGTAHIRKELGLDISPGHFSAVKATEKKKQAVTAPNGKPGRKPKATVEDYLAPPKQQAADDETELLAVMEAMKPMVASLGADKVKRLVDLLG